MWQVGIKVRNGKSDWRGFNMKRIRENQAVACVMEVKESQADFSWRYLSYAENPKHWKFKPEITVKVDAVVVVDNRWYGIETEMGIFAVSGLIHHSALKCPVAVGDTVKLKPIDLSPYYHWEAVKVIG